MNNRENLETLIMVLAICFLFSLPFYWHYDLNKRDKIASESIKVEWMETEIEVNFTDGTSQNYKIDVYENLDNIRVEDGNLSYKKSTKRSGGIVAYKVDLASFVKSFKIVSKKHKFKHAER